MVNADSTHVQARRAIEALRSGVPNRDAVLELGSAHDDIVAKFRQQLVDALVQYLDGTIPRSTGFLVAGNFGTGKSHLLEYLQQIALQQHFVVSKIVISKETPLYDPAKLFRSAIQGASVPRCRRSSANLILKASSMPAFIAGRMKRVRSASASPRRSI